MKKYVLFIGIDISKKWIDAALTLNGHKKGMQHGRFDNTEKGFRKMLKWLSNSSLSNGAVSSSWLFCMEHTGIYTMPLCSFLSNEGLDFVLESALRIQRSLGIKRGKDDKADSKDIARYSYLHRESLTKSELLSPVLMELKNLLTYRSRLITTKKRYLTSSKELHAFSRKEDATEFIVKGSQELLDYVKAQIKATEKQIKALIASDRILKKLYTLVSSVKGIGLIIGVQMIVYTNCFTAFSNSRQFAAYIGTAPFKKKSGSSVNVPAKVSKLGHKKIKALLSNGMMAAIRHDKEINKYYHRKIAEGKSKYSVFNAVKNKLISRVFAVVKRGTPYVELCNYK